MLQISQQRVPLSLMNLVHVDIPEHQAMRANNQSCQVEVYFYRIPSQTIAFASFCVLDIPQNSTQHS